MAVPVWSFTLFWGTFVNLIRFWAYMAICQLKPVLYFVGPKGKMAQTTLKMARALFWAYRILLILLPILNLEWSWNDSSLEHVPRLAQGLWPYLLPKI